MGNLNWFNTGPMYIQAHLWISLIGSTLAQCIFMLIMDRLNWFNIGPIYIQPSLRSRLNWFNIGPMYIQAQLWIIKTGSTLAQCI